MNAVPLLRRPESLLRTWDCAIESRDHCLRHACRLFVLQQCSAVASAVASATATTSSAAITAAAAAAVDATTAATAANTNAAAAAAAAAAASATGMAQSGAGCGGSQSGQVVDQRDAIAVVAVGKAAQQRRLPIGTTSVEAAVLGNGFPRVAVGGREWSEVLTATERELLIMVLSDGAVHGMLRRLSVAFGCWGATATPPSCLRSPQSLTLHGIDDGHAHG